MREIGVYENKRVFELSKREYDNYLKPIKDIYYLITDERILVLNSLIVGDVDYDNNVNIWDKSKPYKRKKKEEKKEENFSEKFLENFDVDEILNRVWTENIYEGLMYKG